MIKVKLYKEVARLIAFISISFIITAMNIDTAKAETDEEYLIETVQKVNEFYKLREHKDYRYKYNGNNISEYIVYTSNKYGEKSHLTYKIRSVEESPSLEDINAEFYKIKEDLDSENDKVWSSIRKKTMAFFFILGVAVAIVVFVNK